MMFSAVENNRTSRAVEKQIETLVLEGVLNAGDRLPGERELSQALDVSRPILREAIGNLEKRNILHKRHGGATVVADVIGTVFADPIVQLIRDNNKARSDYLDYRREIEGVTAGLAAKHVTPADKKILSAIVDEMQSAHDAQDAVREAALDVQFHNAICDSAHNIILLHTMRSCYRLLEDDVFYNRELIYHLDGIRQALLTQHLDIYQSVTSGDVEKAKKNAEFHVDYLAQITRETEKESSRAKISELRLNKKTT